MKKRQKKKNRIKLYKNIISDVALDISLESNWRYKIFHLDPAQKLEISYLNAQELPEYIREDMVNYKLSFWVEIVNHCNEYFDSGLVIFKFSATEFPQIACYSGNNPNAK